MDIFVSARNYFMNFIDLPCNTTDGGRRSAGESGRTPEFSLKVLGLHFNVQRLNYVNLNHNLSE